MWKSTIVILALAVAYAHGAACVESDNHYKEVESQQPPVSFTSRSSFSSSSSSSSSSSGGLPFERISGFTHLANLRYNQGIPAPIGFRYVRL